MEELLMKYPIAIGLTALITYSCSYGQKPQHQPSSLKKEKNEVEKLIVSGNNRLFSADLYPAIATEKRAAARNERETAIQLWNGMLDKLEAFVDSHAASDRQTLKKQVTLLRADSARLINTIKLVHNTVFGAYDAQDPKTKQRIDAFKWDLVHIKNSASALVTRVKAMSLNPADTSFEGKKASNELVVLTGRYVSVSAAKAISDIDKEIKKRTK